MVAECERLKALGTGKYAKVLYRRGTSFMATTRFDSAIDDLKSCIALTLDPGVHLCWVISLMMASLLGHFNIRGILEKWYVTMMLIVLLELLQGDLSNIDYPDFFVNLKQYIQSDCTSTSRVYII